ncbi:MAG: uroporphyrinogen decarboxylase family protein [Mangrovibacterium sp.]
MTPRENLIQLYRRKGINEAPVGFVLCESLEQEFRRRYPEAASYQDHFNFPYRNIIDPGFNWNFENMDMIPDRKKIDWHKYYPEGFTFDVKFDGWGIAHESSPNSMHMTKMHHPLKNFTTLEEFETYPWPDFTKVDFSPIGQKIKEIHEKGLAVFIWQECTIWETAWYLRGMENLMMDMALEDEKAYWLLNTITEKACYRAEIFAQMGADILGLGDDIGMQSSIMMSEEMYRQWLKPRLTKVIQKAKKIKPDILISYHSCGYVEPLIDDLIEAGIDILNPVQPECMDFEKICKKYGDRISFNGTIGTQRLMPFGTPDQIKKEVFKNLDLAGEKGGLFCCPTHMLEPEVPWENIETYVRACHEYK